MKLDRRFPPGTTFAQRQPLDQAALQRLKDIRTVAIYLEAYADREDGKALEAFRRLFSDRGDFAS